MFPAQVFPQGPVQGCGGHQEFNGVGGGSKRHDGGRGHVETDALRPDHDTPVGAPVRLRPPSALAPQLLSSWFPLTCNPVGTTSSPLATVTR